MDDDDLRPRESDPADAKELLENVQSSVGVNARTRRAYHATIDRIAQVGIKHRVGRDGFDDVVEMLLARYAINLARERSDGHPSAFWRPFVRLHVAPLLKYYDADSHPTLINNIARVCHTYEHLQRINPAAIKTPSHGILHPSLGKGSATRFSYILYTWRDQKAYIYDKNVSPAEVPPPDLYPPPPDKRPAGTEEEGIEAGKLVARDAAMAAATANRQLEIPLAPDTSPNGHPWSEPWRRGFARGARSIAQRIYETTRGEIEGKDDAIRRALADVAAGRPPLREEEIQPEVLCEHHQSDTWPPTKKTAYQKAAISHYMRTYANEEDRLRKLREDAARQAREKEQQARREAAQAEAAKKRAETEAKRKAAQAEVAKRKAEAETKRAEEQRRKRHEAEAEAEKERRKRKEAEERTRKLEEAARAEAQRKAELARAEAQRKSLIEARERDKKHRAGIKLQVIKAFVSMGMPENHAVLAATAIEKGAIPRVTIAY